MPNNTIFEELKDDLDSYREEKSPFDEWEERIGEQLKEINLEKEDLKAIQQELEALSHEQNNIGFYDLNVHDIEPDVYKGGRTA